MSASGADPRVVATTVREILNIMALAAGPTCLLQCLMLSVVVVRGTRAGPASLLGRY